MKLKLPEEDSLSENNKIVSDTIESLDAMIAKAEESGFDFNELKRIAEN